MLLLLAFLSPPPFQPLSTVTHPAAASPVHRTFWLTGSSNWGWNLTQQIGPQLEVYDRDNVTLMLIKHQFDGITHNWFLDFNNNFVVDSNEHLRGIITNTDVIRSHIERTSPQKVWTLKKTLEAIHNIHVDVIRETVNINELIPTQPKVYADELDGRIYELKKGLAEPIVVIKKPHKLILVDGHHRVIAAKKLGIKSMDAYVIPLGDEVHLGMEKTAASAGLHTLSDIKILDYAKHPLIEVTKRLKKNDENGLSDIGQ